MYVSYVCIDTVSCIYMTAFFFFSVLKIKERNRKDGVDILLVFLPLGPIKNPGHYM